MTAVSAAYAKALREVWTASHQQRLRAIERAHDEGVALPPILVSFAPAAYVWDGHHRLFVARRRGLAEILARDVRGGAPFMLSLSALAHVSAQHLERHTELSRVGSRP